MILVMFTLHGAPGAVRPRGATMGEFQLTLRSQVMPTFGRKEWLVHNTRVKWKAADTAFVIIDMWDKHWCPSATTRVAEIATPMNSFVKEARRLGANIVWAPSDVTAFYPPTNCSARNNTLSLSHHPLPHARNISIEKFPISRDPTGGCDTEASSYTAWHRQIDTLDIEETDFLIAGSLPANPHAGTQELWNLVASRQIKHLVYMGVHENMCMMDRPFAIETMTRFGFQKADMAVVTELVDVMYTPLDPPYVNHATALKLQTEYIEKFWATSMSMCSLLRSAPQHDYCF